MLSGVFALMQDPGCLDLCPINSVKKKSNRMNRSIALIALFSLVTLNVHAQKTATWKGGTPGRKSDWSCPSNWKEGRVPNVFSNVVIPDVSTSTFSYPVIQEGEIEVQSLYTAPGARITIKNKARLIVLESDAENQPMRNPRMAGTGAAFCKGN
jgi:hypothetical protein